MIKEAITNVGRGITLSHEMSELFHEIVSKAEKAAAMSQEVEASGTKQEEGIGEVKQAVSQLNVVVQSNASASEETAANAEGTKTQAVKLMEAVTALENIVGGNR
jgi:methyl-accepting chemotaxis protein